MGISGIHQARKRWAIFALALVVSGVVISGWYQYTRARAYMTLDQLRLAMAANDWLKVRSGGERYLQYHPEDAEAIVLLARAEAAYRRYDRALPLLAKVPANSPYSPEARLREGQAARQLFRGTEAERCFRRAIDEGPAADAPQRVIDAARLGLVQLFAIEVRNEEARALIWELYRVSPEPLAVLELLGRLDIEGAEPHEAIQELEKFIAADSNDLDACLGLAHHYVVLGRAREARLLADRCLAARPDSLAAWESLLSSLCELGDSAPLAEAIDRAPQAARDTAWYWKYEGIAAEYVEQWEAAEAAFQQALCRDPFDSRTHYRLGRLLHQLGKNLDEADEHIARAQHLVSVRAQLRELYRRVLSNNQQRIALSDELLAAMGEHYEAIGMRDGAAAWYQESLKRNPADARSRNGFARVQSEAGVVSGPSGLQQSIKVNESLQP